MKRPLLITILIILIVVLIFLIERRKNINQTELTEPMTYEFQLDSATTKEFIGAIVDKLDAKCEIDFFDYFHPQISDPGAYVTVYKENGQFKYELANHGWSSDWKIISRDSLVDYIFKNREYNNGKLELKSRHKGNIMVIENRTKTIVPTYYNIDDKKNVP